MGLDCLLSIHICEGYFELDQNNPRRYEYLKDIHICRGYFDHHASSTPGSSGGPIDYISPPSTPSEAHSSERAEDE